MSSPAAAPWEFCEFAPNPCEGREKGQASVAYECFVFALLLLRDEFTISKGNVAASSAKKKAEKGLIQPVLG